MNRRGFLGGLIASIAAPAIVKPFNIMSVRSLILPPLCTCGINGPICINCITREAIKLFVNSNVFIQSINAQYDEEFEKNSIVGTQLRIKLPTDYMVNHG